MSISHIKKVPVLNCCKCIKVSISHIKRVPVLNCCKCIKVSISHIKGISVLNKSTCFTQITEMNYCHSKFFLILIYCVVCYVFQVQ